MRRVDILKMQLLNSRGRFFTAEWVGVTGEVIRANMKVTQIVSEDSGNLRVNVYVPRLSLHLGVTVPVNAKGDCTYIASDRSTFQMSGQRAFNF
jgi:hypothetical protein